MKIVSQHSTFREVSVKELKKTCFAKILTFWVMNINCCRIWISNELRNKNVVLFYNLSECVFFINLMSQHFICIQKINPVRFDMKNSSQTPRFCKHLQLYRCCNFTLVLLRFMTIGVFCSLFVLGPSRSFSTKYDKATLSKAHWSLKSWD